MSPTGTSARTVALGAVLGVAATALMYPSAAPYLGFASYVIILLASLLLYARTEKVQAVRHNLFLLIPILFCTVMLVIRVDDFLAVLNIGAITGATLLLVYFFANGSIARQEILDYPIKATVSAFAVWTRPFGELFQTGKWFGEQRGRWGHLAPFARGAAITVPVVAVFVVLLSSADEVFADLVQKVLNIFSFKNPGTFIDQTIFAGVFAWMAIGGLTYALMPRKAKRMPGMQAPSVDELLGKPPVQPFTLGFTEITMLLSSVCIVFGTFVGIQFVYLFGGQRNIDISKFNYADYVHRGFAELVIVGVLTLGLAYILHAIGHPTSKRQNTIFRGLTTLLMLLTGVILASAFQRLHLYEQAYGYTSLRLLIYVFIGWLAFLFAGFALSLYWLPESMNVFSLTMLIAVFGFVATLDIINPDAFVATQIIQRGDIDPLYLSTLSNEAIPALVSLVDAPEPGTRSIIRNTLAQRRSSLASYRHQNDWREYNIDKMNALSALDTVQDKLNNTRDNNGTYQMGDFAFLKRGMTYKEIVRQLGEPYSYSQLSNYERTDNRDVLSLTYLLADGNYVQMTIDTVDGLTGACNLNDRNTCASSLLTGK